MIFRSLILILLCNLLVNFDAFCTSPNTSIPVVIYYDYPPFFVDRNQRGLGRELAEHLNLKAKGKYSFHHVYIPKGRLDKMLEDPKWGGVVTWVNPNFVNDKSKTKFIWSNPIMHEIDYVATLKDSTLEYKDHTSLYGHSLGTVLNQRYSDVEDELKSGKIIQVSANQQESIVIMLLKKRIEFAFLSHSTIKWFRKEFPEFDDKVKLAKKTRNEFDRHVFITRNLDHERKDFILKTVNNLKNDKDWQERFNQY